MGNRLQEAVSVATASGYQLDKEAFDFLKIVSQKRNLVQLIEEAVKKLETLPDTPLIMNRPLLEETLKDLFLEEEEEARAPPSQSPLLETKTVGFRAYAKEVDADINVIEDPTDKICETGCVDEYLEHFQDRFKKIRKILRQRMDAKDAIPISAALKASIKSKLKFIGMVTERRELRKGMLLRLEDLESSTTVLVLPSTNSDVMEKAQALLLDQVVCVNAVKWKRDMLIAKDFISPNTPQKTPNKASIPVYAALLSDLHVGSKMFMQKEFNRFLLWLNGKLGNENLKKIASHVKYVIIAGDIVDGVGVYPRQQEDLEIIDIYQQYQAVAKFLEKIPEYVELIIIPGNHDASRKALPQPAIPRDYVEPLLESRKTFSFGNPCTLSLHGVELLLYHGRSLDDVISVVPNVSSRTPEKAMKILLQSRHLAPIYGQKTPIAPERRDFMVIERIPDIFHSGHLHTLNFDRHRGVLLVNSGAWQKQTAFQRKMRIEPSPGIVPIVNLQTLQISPISFVE